MLATIQSWTACFLVSCLSVRNRIYKTIIFPVVLYECETWSFTLREDHRMKASEKRVLRRISGPKRNEVTGGWRKLHNDGLHNLYPSRSIIYSLLTYSWSWALLEKLPIVQPLKNFPAFYGTRRFSPSIIRIMKSRKMRWAEHVAHLAEKRNAYRIFVRKQTERGH
jgi:hypothetical protein